MSALRPSSLLPKFHMETLTLMITLSFRPSLKSTHSFRCPRASLLRRFSIRCRFLASAAGGSREEGPSLEFLANTFPISGAEDSLLGFINGKRKATDAAHSRMEDILPKDTPVRLIAFNLGYLPGGDKAIITKPHTTLFALQAASRVIASGGLISIVVYVGHPGGREELETVLSFASSLPVECWNCFKFETANRPSGPVLVFIFKK